MVSVRFSPNRIMVKILLVILLTAHLLVIYSGVYIYNTSYKKLPFGSGDDPDKLIYHHIIIHWWRGCRRRMHERTVNIYILLYVHTTCFIPTRMSCCCFVFYHLSVRYPGMSILHIYLLLSESPKISTGVIVFSTPEYIWSIISGPWWTLDYSEARIL